MRTPFILFIVLLIVALSSACKPASDTLSLDMTTPPEWGAVPPDRQAGAILESYAQAWRGVTEFELRTPVTLGIWIDAIGYTVRLNDEGGDFEATPPDRFDFGFATDLETLRRIDAGTLNALTAMGQARASDPTPLELRLPDEFAGFDDIRGYWIPLTFHFWNREWPETIPFGQGATRHVHGANATVLVYDEGLRSAWYQLKAGMHVNADPADQVNDFASAIIVTRGSFRGKIDGVERAFREGETVIVPPGVAHEFYASDGEYGECVILMWGSGA